MKRLLALILIVTAAIFAFANDKPAVIHNGFGTGQDYLEMSDVVKRAYAKGAINGMLMAPIFGAPKEQMKWFESYLENMSDIQVAAILTKYINDNPGRWHDGLNVLAFAAVKEAHDKSRSPAEKN